MKAIVFISNAGHTATYAKMLGEKTGLPVYELSDAVKKLNKDEEIIYMGWLFANTVKGFAKATKQFNISAIVGVGLCDTGTGIDDLRKVNKIPNEKPYLQCRAVWIRQNCVASISL